MTTQAMYEQWQQESEVVLQGVAQWREEHPKATWREIEQAVDEQLRRLRSRLLQDTAQQSPQCHWKELPPEQRPQCPNCHQALHSRGRHTRRLQSNGGACIPLERTYGTCPHWGAGFFPLVEELALDESELTPHAHEQLVSLALWMPFAQAAKQVHAMLGVQVSDSTARRLCLQAGQAYEQVQSEQASPQGSARFPLPEEDIPERLVMSSDGGLVPLRKGQWAEVKTLVIGQVLSDASSAPGQQAPRTCAHSYFSRLTDAATFADLASVEIKRRGIDRAKQVAAVQDGAEWLQSFVDGHRQDAVRILDFAHTAGYVGDIAEQAQQGGQHVPRGWLTVLLHQFKHHGPTRVLSHLERLGKRWALPAIAEALRYFTKRLPQVQYPQFRHDGWPIGSGSVECGNKVVMQARLKGAGMRWERQNVNPMLALRTAVYSERWAEAWSQQEQWRADVRKRHRQQRAEARSMQRRCRLQAFFLRLWLFRAGPVPPPTTCGHTGRTAAQRRWGRQTFSPKAFHLRHAKM
jgi:hypothetical protein